MQHYLAVVANYSTKQITASCPTAARSLAHTFFTNNGWQVEACNIAVIDVEASGLHVNQLIDRLVEQHIGSAPWWDQTDERLAQYESRLSKSVWSRIEQSHLDVVHSLWKDGKVKPAETVHYCSELDACIKGYRECTCAWKRDAQ